MMSEEPQSFSRAARQLQNSIDTLLIEVGSEFRKADIFRITGLLCEVVNESGVSMEDVALGLRLLTTLDKNTSIQSDIITAPDGVPISDTEYAEAWLCESYSMDKREINIPPNFVVAYGLG